jgi:hypothetical protein
MADLQTVLDKAAKSFGISFNAATKDTLAGQERFYKYIGDKENERRVALERYKRAAIDSVNEETKYALASYEEKAKASRRSQEDINKGKIDLAKKADDQIKSIERESEAKGKGPGIFGRTLEGARNIGSRLGGPIGGLVSGVANLIAEPEVAIPAAIMGAILEIANKRAAFTKTGLQLAGAGLGRAGEGAGAAQAIGSGFDLRLFSGLNGALSAEEQRAIIGGMAGSRTMIGQAGAAGGMDALRGNLGLFANILPDASKEMELFTDATKSLGMSQKDISKTFFQTQKSSKDLGITQLDAIATQIEMQKALRNITNDGTVAASVLDNVGSFFHEIGKSETETQRMTLGVAQAGSNLSLSKIAGMLSFTRGLGPTSGGMEQAIFGNNGVGGMLGKQGGGVFGLMGEFFSKVGGQAKNPMERLFMAESLNKDFGLGIQTQDLPKFFQLSERLRAGGMSQKDYAAQVQELSKAGRTMTIEGMKDLASIVTPIQLMENYFKNFWTNFDDHTGHFFGDHKGATNKTLSVAKNVAVAGAKIVLGV